MNSNKLLCILLVFSFLYSSKSLLSQNINNKTVVKAAIESGSADLHRFFGDGLLYRAIIRVQSQMNFSKAYLQSKGRFSIEYFDVLRTIETFNPQLGLSYTNLFSSGYLQLQADFNGHFTRIDSLGKQEINEWQISGLYNRKISQDFALQFKDTFISRKFSVLNTRYSRNRVLLSLMYNQAENSTLGMGFFWDKLYVDNSDTADNKELRGLQIDYQYNMLIIFNVVYNLGFFPARDYVSHQLNAVAGKYLSDRWSVFLSLFYTWVMDDSKYLELFNRVEIFNNIYFKIACDLSDKTNIYLKGIIEDHKLVDYREKIKSKQLLLGVQYKF